MNLIKLIDIFPLMWIGVKDFRSSHSDKWFVPSSYELINYVYPNKSRLKFDANTGGSSTDGYWSSSEADSEGSYILSFGNGKMYLYDKSSAKAVRLCRDF